MFPFAGPPSTPLLDADIVPPMGCGRLTKVNNCPRAFAEACKLFHPEYPFQTMLSTTVQASHASSRLRDWRGRVVFGSSLILRMDPLKLFHVTSRVFTAKPGGLNPAPSLE